MTGERKGRALFLKVGPGNGISFSVLPESGCGVIFVGNVTRMKWTNPGIETRDDLTSEA